MNCINLDEWDGAHIIIVDVLTRFMGLHLEDLGFSGSGKDGCMNSVIVDENELDSTRLLLSNPFLYPGFSCEILPSIRTRTPWLPREPRMQRSQCGCVLFQLAQCYTRPIPPSIPLQTSA